MHQGRPYGLHVIGGKLTDRDQAFVSVTVKRFSNLKDLSSVDSSRMVYDLPDGGYIVVQDMGGMFRIIAHKHTPEQRPKLEGLAIDYIPMLFSGIVEQQAGLESKGVPLKVSETTRRRLNDYDPEKGLASKNLTLKRFLIKYSPKFRYFEPTYSGGYIYTQYHKLRPTWYSGAISEIVQIVGGYGSQDFSELPDSPLERKRFKLPRQTLDSAREHIANQRLPAYDGVPDDKGQHQYDYRHGQCNNVSFDNTGSPWLLQINSSGVYAMPLPIIPATTSPAFRSYIQDVSDDEILHILDRFGGMPSGENFLTGADFQAWYRAGVIIKVCDTSDFYNHSAFYTACGWSFNSMGTEGFNTGWSFDDQGLRHAYGYKIKLDLGGAINNGWVKNSRDFSDENQELVQRYISTLFRMITGSEHRERAIRYKVMNAPADLLIAQAKSGSYSVSYWENLIAEPIAKHVGSVTQVSKGAMYWGLPSPKSFGALKFPEFTGQGCASFDMTMPEYKGDTVTCDTVVFGCYVNDQLKVIKYFIDNRRFQQTTESNFEKVMIVGQWQETTTNATSGLMGYFYTTDFDDRREASESTTQTKITGEDLGFGNPRYHTPPVTQKWGSLSRSRYYSYRTETTSVSGDRLSVAVCVPALARDAMLYAFTEASESSSYRDKMERRSVGDPTTYGVWTYDPAFYWSGRWGVGEPKPTEGEYVYVNYGDYQPTEYSWFADSGEWYGVPDGSYKDVSGILAKHTDRNSEHVIGGVIVGGEAPRLDTYNTLTTKGRTTTGRVSISITIKGAGNVHNKIPEDWYFYFSPVESGGSLTYFYRDATWITSGESKYASTSEKKANGLRAYWGSTKLADHKSAHCFIGVINE